MPVLTPAQIAGVVMYEIAGPNKQGTGVFTDAVQFPNPDTSGPIFVAIALTESSGNTDAIGGPNANGSHDYGLWQINDKAHPDLISEAVKKDGSWKIPSKNFTMAVSVYTSQGFNAWSTYKYGLYGANLPAATEAWNHPDQSATQTSAVTETTLGAVSAVTGVADLISALTKSETWVRIGMGAAGVVLVLVVVAALMKNHLPGPLGAITRAAKASKAVPAAVTEGVPA
jgi:hypothetical protein